MPSKKAKRKAKQLAANRLAQQERPVLRWLKRKTKKALSRIRQTWHFFWRYLLQPTQRMVVGIVILLAAGAQIYFSTWRMSVTPGETPNATDPFSTMFVLYNEGQFPMYDITFGCRARLVAFDNDALDSTILVSGNMTLESDPFNVSRLEANARTSTPCRVIGGVMLGRPLKVDVSLLISYQPSFFPFRRHAEFRFIAQPNDKGGYSWTPMGD